MIQNIYISENLSEQTAFPFFYECGMAYCSCIVYDIQSKLKGFKERKTIRLIEIYLDVIQIETYLPVYKTVVIHDSKYLHIGKSL